MHSDFSAPSKENDLEEAPVRDPEVLFEKDGVAEPEFLDDLIAAHEMKGYLIAKGVPLSHNVIDGVNKLYSIFRKDIRERRDSISARYPNYSDLIEDSTASE